MRQGAASLDPAERRSHLLGGQGEGDNVAANPAASAREKGMPGLIGGQQVSLTAGLDEIHPDDDGRRGEKLRGDRAWAGGRVEKPKG